MTKRRKALFWGLGALLVASIVIGNLVKSRESQHKVEIEKVKRRDLRALVSASDSSRAWDLRVRVREQLLAHLQEHHPEALPQTRVTLSREATGSAGLQDGT